MEYVTITNKLNGLRNQMGIAEDSSISLTNEALQDPKILLAALGDGLKTKAFFSFKIQL